MAANQQNPQSPHDISGHPGYQSPPPITPGTPPHRQASRQGRSGLAQVEISPDLMAKHEDSKRLHPGLHVSSGEFVISAVRRHPIGLLSIWSVVALAVVVVLGLIPLYGLNQQSIATALLVEPSSLPSTAVVAWPMLLVAFLFVAGGLIAARVYDGNRFYVTNESIIQYIQISLFSTREQQINLTNIEDVSYRKNGILQHLLDYGSIRLSTEGDETTYRFHYVASPEKVVRVINTAIEDATGFAVRYRSNDTNDPGNNPNTGYPSQMG